MKSIILIYTTDPWHSFSSMELIAVATTETKRDILVKRYLKNELTEKPDRKTVETAIQQIQTNGQTDCLSEKCGFELYTETEDTNTIL